MSGKLYSKANRKIVLGVGALICCIAVIALCSFFPFVIDPTQWQTKEFLSDELIVMAIVIFSIVCVMYIGQASNAQNPESNIAKAKVKFMHSISLITDISGFEQWIVQKLQPSDMRTEKESILKRCGIDDMSVIDLEKSEIEGLIDTPQKYNGKYYRGISKYQAEQALKAKYFRMKLVQPTYYLSCSSISADQTISRKSGNENKKKGVLLTWSIASKVSMSVLTAIIFASLVYDVANGDGASQASAWLKFASRMMSMATSSFMGYLIGGQMNDIDADFIENKVLAHTMYLQDKDFKPKTQQEMAKAEFAQRVRKEEMALIEGGNEDERKRE